MDYPKGTPGFLEKEILLSIARDSVIRFLNGEAGSKKANYHGWLSERLGAFVSIHGKDNELRGCIGRITNENPLYKLIAELAVSASSRDYRFNPVIKNELKYLNFEISVLSPLVRIYSPEDFIPGMHGIYIKKGNQTGTFLPQVHKETGWDAETLLGKCSRDKALIGWDGWKKAEIYIYTADIFNEKDLYSG